MQSCPSTAPSTGSSSSSSTVKLTTPKFSRVSRAATASLGFPSDHDNRQSTDSSVHVGSNETDSLADRTAARLRSDVHVSASPGRHLKLATEDLLYSKNNVCVHSTCGPAGHVPSGPSPGRRGSVPAPGPGRVEAVHVPGYLSLRCRGASILGVGSSLILHWVPNKFITNTSYGYGDVAETLTHTNSGTHLANGSPIIQAENRQKRSTSNASNSSGGGGEALPRDVSTFTIDLGLMRSVKIFFNNDDRASGQLVVASPNKQFRVLHFHHGGLPGLQKALEDWPMCSQAARRGDASEAPRSITFNICRTHLSEENAHPEEGMYCSLTPDAWFGFMDSDGRLANEQLIRKIIFFGGITPEARPLVWPFLLNYYPFNSTHEERAAIREDYRTLYAAMKKKREAMDSAERQEFWQKVQCTVEKDVVRTDRLQPFFAGDNNPHTATLQEILLCYAVKEPEIGYTQGMSDLLAPLLAAVQDEVDAFGCFVGMMQFSVLMTAGHSSMHRQLDLMRELMVVQLPTFYSFLTRNGGGGDLLFCHRWLLLNFKREFAHAEALRVWEACWASHPHFPFTAFLCLAVVAVYGGEVLERRLPVDEMLLHFSRLSHQMSVEVVLHQARALVHQLATLPAIPCRIVALLPQLQQRADGGSGNGSSSASSGSFELTGVRKTWRFSCEECRGNGPCHRRYYA
ncbi:TBC1 domain family member 16-like [Sycon ciliatum]|uniref:TBC1 domain family member 16-like n=1 Tax=Sycon ciliatum TaxID=27933 RepID=UPI0020ADF997